MMHFLRTRLWRWVLGILIVAGLMVAAADLSSHRRSSTSAGAGSGAAAKVEPIDGSTVKRVTLTADAVRRLAVQTVPVQNIVVAGTPRLAIPYSAVLYDPSGATWTYTNPQPQVYVRHRITVDSIQADQAVLSAGPPAGTAVVTVGAAELYGTELGIGK